MSATLEAECNLLNLTEDIFIANLVESVRIVIASPLDEGTEVDATAIVNGLQGITGPVTAKSVHIIFGELGGFTAKFHPEIKSFGAGINVMDAPADTHPRVVFVGTACGKALQDKTLGHFNFGFRANGGKGLDDLIPSIRFHRKGFRLGRNNRIARRMDFIQDGIKVFNGLYLYGFTELIADAEEFHKDTRLLEVNGFL